MHASISFYLVDEAGNPLDQRYQTAAARLRGTFMRNFPKLSDPAEISNAVEESARRIARYEREHGQVASLPPFFARVFSNTVKSLLRGGHHSQHEECTTDVKLQVLADRASKTAPSSVEVRVLIREILEHLDGNKQQVIILNVQGYAAQEIAALVGVSERNIHTSLHRARTRARQRVMTRSGDVARPSKTG